MPGSTACGCFEGGGNSFTGAYHLPLREVLGGVGAKHALMGPGGGCSLFLLSPSGIFTVYV